MWRGRARWWFATGELLGGTVVGAVLVVLGSLVRPLAPDAVRWALVVVLGVVVAGSEVGLYSLPLPQNGRQVPPTVVEAGGRVGALQFGFEMGTGLRTYMTSGLPHLTALCVALVAPWWGGLLAGTAFGAGRALMPLLRLTWAPADLWDNALDRVTLLVSVLLVTGSGLVVVGLVSTGGP